MKKSLKMAHKLMLLIGSVIVVAGVIVLAQQLKSSAQIACLVTLTETNCTDGCDNDLDGLVDSRDPDCGGGGGNVCGQPCIRDNGVSCNAAGGMCNMMTDTCDNCTQGGGGGGGSCVSLPGGSFSCEKFLTQPDCDLYPNDCKWIGGGGGGGGQCSEPYETWDNINNTCIDCNHNGSVCAIRACLEGESVCSADGGPVCSTACSAGGGGGGVEKTCFAIYGRYKPEQLIPNFLQVGERTELERIRAITEFDTVAKVNETLRSPTLVNTIEAVYTQERMRELSAVKAEVTRRISEIPDATYTQMRPIFDAFYVATVSIPMATALDLESKYVGFDLRDPRACDTTNGGGDEFRCEEQYKRCVEIHGLTRRNLCEDNYLRCVFGGGGNGEACVEGCVPQGCPPDSPYCAACLIVEETEGRLNCGDNCRYQTCPPTDDEKCLTNPRLCLADCIGNPRLCLAVVLDSEIIHRVKLDEMKQDLSRYFAPIEAQMVEIAVAPTENVVANAVDNNVLETQAVVETVNQAAETAATLILDIPPISAVIDATVQQAITADAASNASEKAVGQIKALNPSVTATEIAAVQAQVTKTVTEVITAKVNAANK